MWNTYESLKLYINDADKRAQRAKDENGGIDPLLSFWRFDPKTAYDTMDSFNINK